MPGYSLLDRDTSGRMNRIGVALRMGNCEFGVFRLCAVSSQKYVELPPHNAKRNALFERHGTGIEKFLRFGRNDRVVTLSEVEGSLAPPCRVG